MDLYILYSTRSQGWFTYSSTYSSDYRQAKHFVLEDAIEFSKRHKTQSGYGMIPVCLAHLEEI